MKLKFVFFIFGLFSILILSGCSQKTTDDCDSKQAPTITVICKFSGTYQEYNQTTAQMENHPLEVCTAYLADNSKEIGTTYRVWGFSMSGCVSNDITTGALGGSNTVYSEGTTQVPINADCVKAWPQSTNGKFCLDKTTKVFKKDFITS